MEYLEKYSITIEDLAKKHGKTQQAIRNYIDRYPDDLQGHYHRENGSTWLDADAVAFIEGKIKPKKPDVAVFNSELEEKIRELQDKLIEAHERYEKLMAENKDLYLKATENNQRMLLYMNDKDKAMSELTVTINANERLQKELQEEREEKKKAWATKDRFEAELEKAAELNASLQAQADEQAAELEALKNRGFWKRLFNKE